MVKIYVNWYDYRGKKTSHTSRKAQQKAAYDYLKKYPTSKAVVNCNVFVDGKQKGDELSAVYWANVDGKRQIIVHGDYKIVHGGVYYLLKSDGSKGKKLRQEYLYDSDHLIYGSKFFT